MNHDLAYSMGVQCREDFEMDLDFGLFLLWEDAEAAWEWWQELYPVPDAWGMKAAFLAGWHEAIV